MTRTAVPSAGRWASLAVVLGSLLLTFVVLEVVLRVEEAVRLDEQFRGPMEWPPRSAPPAGMARIVALGDSYTRGVYVEPKGSYPAQLASALNADGPRVEILNLGEPGANTVDALAMLREALPDYGPDVVTLGFFANDVERGNRERRADSARAEGAGEPVHRSTRLLQLRDRSYLLRFLSPRISLVLYRLGLEIPGAIAYAPRLESVYAESKPRFEVCKDALLQMRNLCREHDAHFLVLLLPVLTEFGDRYPLQGYHAAVADFCRAHDIEVLDTLPAFEDERAGRLHVSLLDNHPNAYGYRIIANAAAAHLERLGWLEDG